MQKSSVFNGTKELENERLAVLAILVRIDPGHTQSYEAETRKITRDQLIQSAIRDVEQSKVYVDIGAIQKWAEQNLRERFLRYRELRAAGVGAEKESLLRAIQNAVAGKQIAEELLQLPEDEATDLLVDMVRQLLRQCTSDPIHGLDLYLSMRIRHGTLSGQLRSPLEAEHLITYRAADSNEYMQNKYWADRLNHLDWTTADTIAHKLGAFSAEYDKRIDRIANDFIQIWSSEKPHAWFRISFTAFELQLLASNIDAGATFDEFLDQGFGLFWDSLKICLENISKLMDSEIKPAFFSLLENLEKDIHQIAQGKPTFELDSAIRTARTGVMQALDRVDRWFKLPVATTTPVSSFVDLLDVGLRGVTNIHPDFDPVLERDIPELPEMVGGLTLFSDIFFVIFNNIRLHSGIPNRPRVWVRVGRTENRLQITIENEISEGVFNETSAAKIATIHDRIDRGDYQRSVSSEGRSGLTKLRSLIGSDHTPPLKLDFGFRGTAKFFVHFELSMRETSRRAIRG